MNYHINTGLIHEKFATDCECPLCQIKKIVEEQFLTEYLNDAVTDDDTRMEVNAEGFCFDHYKKLFARPNKLSLALQVSTRFNTVIKNAGTPTDVKSASKTAISLKKSATTCIVCHQLSIAMGRYYIGVAELYLKEPVFREELLKSKGLCLEHYAELLAYSKYAGNMAKNYIKDLTFIEERAFERLNAELKWFCDKHDYRNRLKPMGTSADILPRMSEKLYGKKIED